MSEVILGIIILFLITAFCWYIREQNAERVKLINHILSKTTQDYVTRTLADATEKIKPEVNPIDSDLVPFDQLNEEDFDKHIQQTLGNETTDEEQV